MVEIQQLAYMPPRKERHKRIAGPTVPKTPRLLPKSLKAMQFHAKLVKLCKENGVPDCKDSVPDWKLKKYLRQKGIAYI